MIETKGGGTVNQDNVLRQSPLPPPVAIDLRTDRRSRSCVTDNPTPTFSWRLVEGASQTAYQLRLSSDANVIWISDVVFSASCVDVPYSGPALSSLTRYSWQVKVWSGDCAGPWSKPAEFETGVLDPSMWSADWIGAEVDDQVLYLRGVVDLPAEVVRARACVTALGWYRFFVNGQDQTGNDQVPRWTHYDHIIEYQVYDVTAALKRGANVLALAIGDGRFRGHNGIADKRALYGEHLAGLAQIEVELADGTKLTLRTNSDWYGGKGRIITSDPKRGEQADLRIADSDWLCGHREPERFSPVTVICPPTRKLVAEEVERVKDFRRLKAQKVWRSPTGKLLIDFGQNVAGVMRMRVTQPAGAQLTLTFSEVIGRDGELDTRYLFGDMATHPPQRDSVISAGHSEWWQPWFTIHGFRFVEIVGAEIDPEKTDFEAVVLSTDLNYHGEFSCSDDRINQLVRNVRWSMISNFVDTPTDCPTRERSGWTGDIQVFAKTATVLADVQPYLRRYLRNLALDQHKNGAIPPYIPGDATRHSGAAPRTMRQTVDSVGWGDASVMVPWVLYQQYGDRLILERQYESMRRWVDHLASLARRSPGRGRVFPRRLGGLEDYVVDNGFHWGEWLRPGESMPMTYMKHSMKAPAAVATAYFANSSRLLAKIAQELGHELDASRYGELAEKAMLAWRAAFVQQSGKWIGDDRQDDYVRALAFELLPIEQRQNALARLVELIEQSDFHLGTGFLSTSLLLPVLAQFGRVDLAYRLLLQDTNPSWLCQIERGATTIWESWEGYNKDGDARYSHNHYAFGAVAAWLFDGVAGITPAEPGYRRIRISPNVGSGLTHASAEIMTTFGKVRSAWSTDGEAVQLSVHVPPGASAEVVLGNGEVHEAGPGETSYKWHRGLAC